MLIRDLPAAILTVNRLGLSPTANYVDRAVASLEASGFFAGRKKPLYLVAGTRDASHLARYRGDMRYRVIQMTESDEEQIQWKRRGPKSRASASYGYFIKLMADLFPERDLLLLEEDNVYSKGWIEFLERIIPEIQQSVYRDRWILSFYSALPEVVERHAKGERWFDVPPEKFFSINAMIYPKWALQSSIRRFFLEASARTEMCNDEVVPLWAIARDLTIIATAPSLVQHVGDVSFMAPPNWWKDTAHLFFDEVSPDGDRVGQLPQA